MGYGLKDGSISSFSTGCKRREQCYGAQYFVPFSKQHGGDRKKDAVDISLKVSSSSYSPTQTED
jgi:hypothetical protein